VDNTPLWAATAVLIIALLILASVLTTSRPVPVVVSGVSQSAQAKPAWLTVIGGDPSEVEKIRGLASTAGLNFTSLSDSDALIDRLNFRSIVTSTGLPVAIFQAGNGSVIAAKRVESAEEIGKILKGN
jgi:hypothetical protein